MMKLDRRDFLTATAAGTLGLATAKTSLAIAPMKREWPAKYSFSLAAYSYRDLLQGDSPELTLFDFIDDCSKFGIEGAELTSYYFEDPVTDEYLRQLKRHAFLRGVDISGTAIRCDFGVPPGDKRDKEIADVKRWIERAEILGAPVIRIFAGKQPKGQSAEQTHELIVSGINECCKHAGEHGVYLALENHHGPTATADGLLAIVKDVDSEWFGVNLDTGNFRTGDPYAQMEAAMPYAVNVQVKVVTCDVNKENKKPTDFARVAKILNESHYRGYVVLEYEEEGDPREKSKMFLKTLQEAFC